MQRQLYSIQILWHLFHSNTNENSDPHKLLTIVLPIPNMNAHLTAETEASSRSTRHNEQVSGSGATLEEVSGITCRIQHTVQPLGHCALWSEAAHRSRIMLAVASPWTHAHWIQILSSIAGRSSSTSIRSCWDCRWGGLSSRSCRGDGRGNLLVGANRTLTINALGIRVDHHFLALSHPFVRPRRRLNVRRPSPLIKGHAHLPTVLEECARRTMPHSRWKLPCCALPVLAILVIVPPQTSELVSNAAARLAVVWRWCNVTGKLGGRRRQTSPGQG